MATKRPQLAKLTRPRLHNAVPRERLFALLDEARQHKPAICVVGPPGAGKTTLVASWLDIGKIPGAWYQVDPGDADLATFFYYLGEAAKCFSRRSERRLPLLTPEYLQDVEGFARRFFRELFARMPDGGTLVLDNYQEVASEHQFHQLIALAIAEVPQAGTLIAISRRDPPDCYARLLANEKVAFLQWEDLQLTLGEAQNIAETRGLRDPASIDAIYRSTGGWAAGLVLALEHRSRKSEHRADADQITQDAIFSYFANEILDCVTEDTRQVLVRTAFLPQVRASVAQELTGNDKAPEVLEEFYSRHLFTHRKPGDEPIYWYHALFQGFLQRQATRLLSARDLRSLKLASARVLERHEEIDHAVALYDETEQWDEAARLILAQASALVAQGRGQTLQDWAARLPTAVTQADPWLCYWLGMSLTPIDQDAAKVQFARTFDLFNTSKDAAGMLLCSVASIEAIFMQTTDHRQMDLWIERLEPLLAGQSAWTSPDAELRAYSAALIAFLYRRTKDVIHLEAYASRVLELLASPADVNTRMMAATKLMLFCAYIGRIETGRQVLKLGNATALSFEVSPHNKAMWFIWSGYYQRNASTYDAARQALQTAYEIAASHGLRSLFLHAHYHRALVEAGQGNLEEAERYLQALDEVADTSHRIHRGGRAGAASWIAVCFGNANRAIECGRIALDAGRQLGSPSYLVYWGTPLVYGLIETGQWSEAQSLLEEIRLAARGAFPYFEPIAECALARMEMLQGREGSARGRVFAAFESAERADHGGFLAWIRPWMPTFCAWVLDAGRMQPFVRALIARENWDAPARWIEVWPWPVKVYTLGRFQVLVGEKPLAFGRKTPRKLLLLLKALIALGGHDVPQQKLIDLVWPDEEGDAAKHAFEVTLHRLRKLLGHQDAIQCDDGAVSANDRLVWIDVCAFESLVMSILSGEARQNELKEIADRGLAIYRGEFLNAEVDAPWAVSCRERVRSRFARLVSQVSGYLEAHGHWDDAARWYLRGLDMDDLTESFYQGLMRCHLAQKRYSDGMAVYRRLRETLSVTLGIAPSPDSHRLFQALQVGVPNL